MYGAIRLLFHPREFTMSPTGVIANVGVSMARQAEGDQSALVNNKNYIELMTGMLTTMKDVFSVCLIFPPSASTPHETTGAYW